MKVRIAVGEVDIRLEDIDLTHRQIRGLIKYAVGAAAAVAITSNDNDTEEAKHPLGFAATIERLPEEIPQDNIDWYFEE